MSTLSNGSGSASAESTTAADSASGGLPAGVDGFDSANQTFLPIKDAQKSENDWRMRQSSAKDGAAGGGSSSSSKHDGEARLRERLLRGQLRPVWRKESLERRLRVPLQVAKRTAPKPSGSSGPGGTGAAAVAGGPGNSPMPDLVIPQKKSLRPTSPTYESAFRRHVVNRPVSPGVPRRRPSLVLSPSNSFNKVKRTPSPNVAEVSTEIMRKKAEKARKAKVYLLQQAGPNSFVIASEGCEGKVKVVVGPQTCSCGKGASGCVHILFVMLRVFQLDENDGLVWSRQLRNFEVETLFNNFHMRRTQRIRSSLPPPKHSDANDSHDGASRPHDMCGTDDAGASLPGTQHSVVSHAKEEQETTTCPICLLQMNEGEQLVLCEACRNLLHQQCMSIWFRLCSRQGDQLSCPLCRAKWRHLEPESLTSAAEALAVDDAGGDAMPVHEVNPSASHLAAPSSAAPHHGSAVLHTHPDVVAALPRSEGVPEESLSQAAPWIELFGDDLVSCIFSRNWVTRETALRHLSHESIKMLVVRAQSAVTATAGAPPIHGSSGVVGAHGGYEAVLGCCCQILAMMCGDPVYKVYVAALRALRTLLSYTPCAHEGGIAALQGQLRPVLHSILLKCADSNRRTSQLSLSTLSEFAKGQAGELAVSTEVRPIEAQGGLGGLAFVLQCMIEDFDVASIPWQWLLGRLAAMEKLLDEFPGEFSPAQDSSSRVPSSPVEAMLYSIVRFSLKSMKLSHTRVLRTAKKVFLSASHYALLLSPGALSRIRDMLALVDLGIQSRLEKRLIEVAQRTACLDSATSGPARVRPAAALLGVSRPSSAPQSRVPSPSPYSYDSDSWAYAAEQGSSDAIAASASSAFGGRSKTVFGCLYQPMPESAAAGDVTSSAGEPLPSLNAGRAESKASGDDSAVVLRVQGGSSDPQQRAPVHRLLASHAHAVEAQESPSGSRACAVGHATPRSAIEAAAATSHPDVCSRAPAAEAVQLQDLTRTGGEGKTQQPHADSGTQCADSEPCSSAASALANIAAATSSGSGDELKTSDSSAMPTEDLSELSALSPSDNAVVSFRTEVSVFSPLRRTPESLDADGYLHHCKDDVELEEAIALARAMDVSIHQEDLPHVPGLSDRKEEETITIHVQESGGAGAVQYLENVHWKRGKTLGTGAFSTCYQARDCRTGILMAVKQISFCRNTMSEQVKVCDAVREEIEMMARLSHPNLVRILGATQTGCHFNMFVEWMPGGSVAHLLDSYGAFSEPVISSYIHQVIMGLAYLHDSQVLHRDLKGANLLVDSTGQHIRIGDFGACGRLATQMTGAGEFRGQMLGTIAFMAPEVLRGEHYGRACDVWGVGCIMIEMATTRPPWSASAISNHLKLIFTIASSTAPPPIPDNMSPAVKDLMLRCLETNPSYRPSAKELLQHPLFIRYAFRPR